jgi:hypothetical protein
MRTPNIVVDGGLDLVPETDGSKLSRRRKYGKYKKTV